MRKLAIATLMLIPALTICQTLQSATGRRFEIIVEPLQTAEPTIRFENAQFTRLNERTESSRHIYEIRSDSDIAFAIIGFQNRPADSIALELKVPIWNTQTENGQTYYFATRKFLDIRAENAAITSWGKDSPASLWPLRRKLIRLQELAAVSKRRMDILPFDLQGVGLLDILVMYKFVELGAELLESGNIALGRQASDNLTEVAMTIDSIARKNGALFENATGVRPAESVRALDRIRAAETKFVRRVWDGVMVAAPVTDEACIRYWKFAVLMRDYYDSNREVQSMPESLLLQCALEARRQSVHIERSAHSNILAWLANMKPLSRDASLVGWYNDLFR